METNILINYTILEKIIRLTGNYKNICDDNEYPNMPSIFGMLRSGELVKFISNDKNRVVLPILTEITGISEKYWTGEKRLTLGIRGNKDIVYYDTISTVEKINNSEELKEYMKNPLGLAVEELYRRVNKIYSDDIFVNTSSKDIFDQEYEDAVYNELDIIQSIYSLTGLIKILLINMEENGTISLIDKANIYKASKWDKYIRKLDRQMEQGIKS